MCYRCAAYVVAFDVSGAEIYLRTKQVYQKKRVIFDIFNPHAFKYVAPLNSNFPATKVGSRHVVRDLVYGVGGAEE